MILNRRMLLAALGLSFPAMAAEAATRTHRRTKPLKKPLSHKVAAHKPRKPAAPKPLANS